jgi:predicted RecB family endonuclease
VAARDIFHDAVIKALEKEGWSITHDPMSIQVGGVEMYIDLGAEKLIAAEKEGQKIAVEIKSFVNVSAIYEFHLAIGQYRNYFLALSKEDSERVLYLAVPEDIYDRFFTLQFVQEALVYNEVNYIVYDVQEEAIVRWQK